MKIAVVYEPSTKYLAKNYQLTQRITGGYLVTHANIPTCISCKIRANIDYNGVCPSCR